MIHAPQRLPWRALRLFASSPLVFALIFSAAATPPNIIEREAILYVQDPHFADGKKAIQVVWIPEPVERYCLDKTHDQCAAIDYCSRTTNPGAAMCQKLGIPVSRLPKYPADLQPRRVLSITIFMATNIKGWDALLKWFDSQPPKTFDRLSAATRIKGKVRLTRKPDDDDLYLLEVLAAPLQK
jgi:hypothetical protein